MVLTLTERPSTPILALVAFAMFAVIGLAVSSTSAGSSQGGMAELEIGGVTFQFTPRVCAVSDTDFLAAGSGRIDGEDFWISVSPESAEVAVGTADERTRSDESDDLWLMSHSPIAWETDGQSVEARVAMSNERVADAPVLVGDFTTTCSS